MRISRFLQAKQTKNLTEDSSCTSVPLRRQSFIDYLIGKEQYNLAAYQALNYYSICDPLFGAVDRITSKLREIQPLVYDTKEKGFVTEGNIIADDINKLLQSPSFITPSYSDFIEALTVFYIVTGNAYYIINSVSENREPQALEVVHPQNVSPIIGSAGSILYYNVEINGEIIRYDIKKDIPRGKIVYYSESNSGYSELYNIKKFNPRVAEFGSIGFSQLTPLYYQLEQTLAVSRHNLSLLKRGTTLSGVFLCEHQLSDENLQRFQAMINEYFSGENSAGKPFVMDNAEGWTYSAADKTSKDMDFDKLDGSLKQAIYNNLKIPLPKVVVQTMTMSNMDNSSEALYDDAVLPVLNIILSNLTLNLVSRYDNSKDLKLSYDVRQIPALESRNIRNMATLKEINVLTDNEIREDLNYPALGDGADDLYQPATLLPYAR